MSFPHTHFLLFYLRMLFHVFSAYALLTFFTCVCFFMSFPHTHFLLFYLRMLFLIISIYAPSLFFSCVYFILPPLPTLFPVPLSAQALPNIKYIINQNLISLSTNKEDLHTIHSKYIYYLYSD